MIKAVVFGGKRYIAEEELKKHVGYVDKIEHKLSGFHSEVSYAELTVVVKDMTHQKVNQIVENVNHEVYLVPKHIIEGIF